MAYLNRALANFRNAVNAAYPNRDKASDGWIGDPAHQATSSDHNPDPAGQPDAGSVDAWDMDVDLRSGNDAAVIEGLKRVFEAHPSSRYWIHNRIEASRSTGWRRVRYTGSNPHDKHVHWNTRESHESSTAPWAIEGEGMALSTEELREVTRAANAATEAVRLLVAVRGVVAGLGAVIEAESSNPAEVQAALASLPQPPTAEQIADATVTRLGGGDLDDAADALRAAFGDRLPELVALLTVGPQG